MYVFVLNEAEMEKFSNSVEHTFYMEALKQQDQPLLKRNERGKWLLNEQKQMPKMNQMRMTMIENMHQVSSSSNNKNNRTSTTTNGNPIDMLNTSLVITARYLSNSIEFKTISFIVVYSAVSIRS